MNLSRGGVPKRPVPEARLTPLGLDGDAVRHPRIHGGPTRALCLYAQERLDALREEGHPVFAGALGENLTLEGLDWDLVVPGARLEVGDGALVEVLSFTTPCRTIAPYFAAGGFDRVHQDKFPGWSRVYAGVVREGVVREGDPVRLLPSS